MVTVIHGDFEWDEEKAAANFAKHGISFSEAAWSMRDPLAVDFYDLVDPGNLVTLAASATGSILYVVSTERGGRIRIISAPR